MSLCKNNSSPITITYVISSYNNIRSPRSRRTGKAITNNYNKIRITV